MMYDRYAEVYDVSGQVHFSLRMISYLAELLPRHAWKGESALDLACGTGTLALSYAQQGLRAYGVDASAAMLVAARQKAVELDLQAEFSQQDMRSFSLPEPVDLVTCCYDSVNYLLSPADLRATFGRVAAALCSGGLFAFDVITPWMCESMHAETNFVDREGLALVVQPSYDASTRLVSWKLTGFVQRGDVWERFEELHSQRAHQEDELAEALAGAGLETEARYVCFGFDPPRADTSRVMWVARKG